MPKQQEELLTTTQVRSLIGYFGGMEHVELLLDGYLSMTLAHKSIDTSIQRSCKDAVVVAQFSNGVIESWEPMKVVLHTISLPQRANGFAALIALMQLKDPTCLLNGAYLDFILKRPSATPTELMPVQDTYPRSVFFYDFWGTIYQDLHHGRLFIRALRWDGRELVEVRRGLTQSLEWGAAVLQA